VLDNLRAAALMLPKVEVEPAIQRVLGIFPELEVKLEQPGRTLSGGQKQMVCMAQALLARPSCWWWTSCRWVWRPWLSGAWPM